MKTTSILCRLEKKGAKVEELAEEMIENNGLLRELLGGVSSSNPRVKFGVMKILRIISKRNPEALYPDMEFFVNLLKSENSILKWNAMDIIANLTQVDSLSKFDGSFKKFYGLLNEGSLITAGHVVDNSATIALAKLELQDKITKELLKVEQIPMPTEECRNILIGKTISAFGAYYDRINNNKDEVVSFVKRQLSNSRRTTRTKAEKFLKKLEKH